MAQSRVRCGWADPAKAYYVAYHDEEWGVPLHDDRQLFEMLVLEGAQAGLSWDTILRKRGGYREAFHGFDVEKVAAMTDAELEAQLSNEAIVRNRLKVFSARKNARVFIDMQKEFGSFDTWLWQWVDGSPIQNRWKTLKDLPVKTALSDAISKDLKKRGMSFVGSTIIYAFMQAVGLVNDHTTDCFRYEACNALG